MIPVQGRFITVEGIEGVGKSTALEYLQTLLHTLKIKVECTREPGGTPVAEAIRRVLLAHHEEAMTLKPKSCCFLPHAFSMLKP